MKKMEKKVYNFNPSSAYKIASMGRTKKEPIDNVGVDFGTYIDEVVMANKAQQRMSANVFSKPTSWGNFMENYLFGKLSTVYRPGGGRLHDPMLMLSGYIDYQHPDYVIEAKNPYTLLSFCQTIEALNGLDDVETAKALKEFQKKWYWQIVAYAILINKDRARLILHMPYEDEIKEIQQIVYNYDSIKQEQYKWIYFALDHELPSLKKIGSYKDVNYFDFQIPLSDISFLQQRLRKAKEIVQSRLESA